MRLYASEYAGPDNAPVLVVLHGLFGSNENWRWQSRCFASRFRVFALDLPNHGRSPATEKTAFDDVARVVATDIRSRGIQRASFLGHSMGGKVAMAIALGDPDLVESLVIADIAARRYQPRHDEIFRAVKAVDAAQPPTRGSADRLMAEHIDERAIRAFILRSYVPAGAEGARWKTNFDALSRGYQDVSDWPFEKGCFPGETLLIRAENSDYVVDSDIPRIQQHFPHLTVESMSGVSHWLHAEKPEEFCRLVLEFLA